MCLTVFLLADRPLPVPPDAAAYPGLKLHSAEADYGGQTLDGIRRIADAAFAYNVSPAGYCGCYFGYETAEEFQAAMAERAANPDLQYANTPDEAETMWRSRMDAVHSLSKYLAAHLEAHPAVYAVWERCAGQKPPVRANVPPSYFGGTGFERLPEDVLLTVVPESTAGANTTWDPASRRTHEWLGCGCACGENDSDIVADETQQIEDAPNQGLDKSDR
jgi:hypothetical protein